MSTSGLATPPARLLALLLLVVGLAGACSLPGTGAAKAPSPAASSSRTTSTPSSSPSPSVSQNPSPVPVTSSYGVLVSSLSGSSYTVSLVGIDGRVIASGIANTPGTVTCANAAAGLVPPPVSTSDSRVYFMDALGVVRFLGPNGDTGQVTTLPIGPSRRSLFAVSPDGTAMSVVVVDFTATGATSRLYLYDLQAGASNLVFSQSGATTLWPIGWHGPTNLVLATAPACTQGGGFGCCGPQELHIVDPKTAVRRFIIGGSGCLISGPPSPGGVSCETNGSADMVYSWSNQLLRTYPIPGVGQAPVYISPDGQHLALSTNPNETTVEGGQTLAMNVCGWIDDTHLLAGGDAQSQPRVGDINGGAIVPVAAQGDCAGRIPGGL